MNNNEITLELKAPTRQHQPEDSASVSIKAVNALKNLDITYPVTAFLAASIYSALLVGEPVSPGNIESKLPPPKSIEEVQKISVKNSKDLEEKHISPPESKIPKMKKMSNGLYFPCKHELKRKLYPSLEEPFPTCRKLYKAHTRCDELQYQYAYRLFMLFYATKNSHPKIASRHKKEIISTTKDCHKGPFQKLLKQI